MDCFDIIVIGAGIAGVSVAAHLAQHRRVCILEMEERAAYHTTGRSAAMFEPNYGPPAILALTRASAAFFSNPPPGFADAALITPRLSLFLVPPGQENESEAFLAKAAAVEEIAEDRAHALYPVLRRGFATPIFLDRHTADIDVDLLHRGYLRLFRERGGTLHLHAGVSAMARTAATWTVTTAMGAFKAPVIVNAAGAWSDQVASMAGAKPVGLAPLRRSIGVVPAPPRQDISGWPMVTDVGETWYSKPQSGKLIVSSADATPVEPHDAYADDMAIAEGIERMMTATTLEVERLEHSWGGLRTFAPDGNPVVGFDPHTDGFFWLVGQGGYGIQSCPALSELAAALLLGGDVLDDILEQGLNVADLSPERLMTP